MSTETEYGLFRPGEPHADAVTMSTQAVQAYAPWSRRGLLDSPPVEWDYRGEDPLNDLRGYRLARTSADPSMLTDDPYHLAPPGGVEYLPHLDAGERTQISPSGMVIANGGRLYVDHAHPEYSAPEVSNALDAVVYDRAGEVIAVRIMEALEDAGEPIVLVKNNVDGKGATYGAHENYQVSRDTDLDDLIRMMIPFLVTRPIYCGAGRVGIGQQSEEPGFQISQRADYVENDIGLETTFNRPIFNTRDEPHADEKNWRRIHIIGGDANLFDISTFLRLGTTSLILWAIEQGTDLRWEGLDLLDPVTAVKIVSRDLTMKDTLPLYSGKEMTATQIQRTYLELVKDTFTRNNVSPTPVQTRVLGQWEKILKGLEEDIFTVAAQVEWVAKYQLMLAQKNRAQIPWDDAKLRAIDLQWADLRPTKSLVKALERRGMVERLFTDEEIQHASDYPPTDTRATIRGNSVANQTNLVGASWVSLLYETADKTRYERIPLPDPTTFNPQERTQQ